MQNDTTTQKDSLGVSYKITLSYHSAIIFLGMYSNELKFISIYNLANGIL